MKPRPDFKADAVLLGITAFWGVTFVMVKDALDHADTFTWIALRFAVGLSIADTAKALGKREGNIKALQHKAVARLQKMLIPPPRQQEAVKRT